MKFAYPWPERNAYAGRMQQEYAARVKISLPLHLRRHANLQLLVAEVGGVTALAALAASPRPHISALASGDKPCGNRLAAKIEAGTGKAPGWLDQDRPAILETGAPGSTLVAHDLSYPQVKTPPTTVWEDVMSLETMPVVPADLMVEVPDDALAPRGVSRGQHIWFKAASKAEPRNVVLIEANGRRYIRRYAEDSQGPFAQALDDAYPSFREFKVVAVMHMRPESSI